MNNIIKELGKVDVCKSSIVDNKVITLLGSSQVYKSRITLMRIDLCYNLYFVNLHSNFLKLFLLFGYEWQPYTINSLQLSGVLDFNQSRSFLFFNVTRWPVCHVIHSNLEFSLSEVPFGIYSTSTSPKFLSLRLNVPPFPNANLSIIWLYRPWFH